MRKILCLLVVITGLSSCGELQQVINQLPEGGGPLTQAEIGAGLREALNQGIERQVVKLAAENGFYGNERLRILLPEQLQRVDRTLRDLGMGKLADDGLRLLNRAAEDAVGEAIPIFAEAVKGITFTDAKNILLGPDSAATVYLEGRTRNPLYGKFNPIIKNSFQKVGADRVWSQLIQRYNSLPLVEPVNPDLADYVTGEALKGVYTAIADEEKDIRNRISARSSELLRKVFALQDSYGGRP